MARSSFEIPLEKLRASVKPKDLPFSSTEELIPLEGVIGQERAVRAMDFGLHIQDRGYNIFVCGLPGTGKSTVVKSMVKKAAAAQPTPGDWCYVHNFRDPDQPRALKLAAGRGKTLKKDMTLLIGGLKTELPKVFQSKEYQGQKQEMEEKFTHARDGLTDQLETRAREHGFRIKNTPVGMAVMPVVSGKTLDADDLEALDSEKKREIEKKEKELREHIHTFVQQIRMLREEIAKNTQRLERESIHFSSEHFFERLRENYSDFPWVLDYIHDVQADVLENFKDFLPEPESPLKLAGIEIGTPKKQMTRYAVNVVVDHSATRGVPVLEEQNPIYNNLIGRIEKRGHLGNLYTDFTLIKGGSILQANGGFLILNVLDILRTPFSWDALKRVIKNKELKIEDVGELYGFMASSGIKPQPIPVRIRVVLIGNPEIYYLLQEYDEDFKKIFKVKVDFESFKTRDTGVAVQFGSVLARLCKEEGLLHFDRSGVAVLMEQSSRWVDHQDKFSLRFSDLADLAREASYWAGKEGRPRVLAADVRRAVEEKLHRSNLLEERIRDLIAEGTLMVDVRGEVTGQVNGLSVYDLGDFAFGRPSRITARVFLGQTGIINIEREAKLSGRTHSKGVMILSGYLGGRYARDNPLALSATLCFEQSYGEVEGDSASVAELVALLSCLAEVPVPQGIAITGSVNQHGELQPVGGVNEKIEGFLAACEAMGPEDPQGVIIPKGNVRNLMLNEKVRRAVEQGRFHIYAASTVDEVLEILTGRPAGELQDDGAFPPETLNAAVSDRLREMGERLRELEPQARPEIPAPEEEDELVESGGGRMKGFSPIPNRKRN